MQKNLLLFLTWSMFYPMALSAVVLADLQRQWWFVSSWLGSNLWSSISRLPSDVVCLRQRPAARCSFNLAQKPSV
jgi:hypothetical protein